MTAASGTAFRKSRRFTTDQLSSPGFPPCIDDDIAYSIWPALARFPIAPPDRHRRQDACRRPRPADRVCEERSTREPTPWPRLLQPRVTTNHQTERSTAAVRGRSCIASSADRCRGHVRAQVLADHACVAVVPPAGFADPIHDQFVAFVDARGRRARSLSCLLQREHAPGRWLQPTERVAASTASPVMCCPGADRDRSRRCPWC